VIILDTNVLSEVFKPIPSGRVINWLAAQDQAKTFTTVITRAEILSGIAALPEGKRKRHLESAVRRMFLQEFGGRILSFDEPASDEFAAIVSARNRMGRPISQFDAMISAIARVHGAALATRNGGDFAHCDIRVENPWI
jgi:hypothetical protein